MTASERMAAHLWRKRARLLLDVLALCGEATEASGEPHGRDGWAAVFDELHMLDRADSRLAARASAYLAEVARGPELAQLRRFQRRWLRRFPRLLVAR